MSDLHVPWRDSAGNTVYLDTFRTCGNEIVLASWTAPQNIALAHWAKLVEKGSSGPGLGYSFFAKTTNHRRFVSRLPGAEGWLHVAIVHEDALCHRQIENTHIGFGVDQAGLEDRVRQIVPVPLQPGWGLLLGMPKLVRMVDGFGRPAWSITLSPGPWVERVRAHLGITDTKGKKP